MRSQLTTSALVLCAALLGGCGGGLTAPDPWQEDRGADAFLDRVSKHCAKHTIGGNTLPQLIDDNQYGAQTDYFIDITTKLYFGKVSRNSYANNVNAFFPAGDNTQGLDCIFAELDAAGSTR